MSQPATNHATGRPKKSTVQEQVYFSTQEFRAPSRMAQGTTIAAAGTNQATGATPKIDGPITLVTAANGTKAITLPVLATNTRFTIVNDGGSDVLKIYPPSGGKINNGTTDAKLSGDLAANASVSFWCKTGLLIFSGV
jgi:hypothetical protein